jgi:hypothetical protein
MKRSNCFFYAISQWFKHGGYIAFRRCKFHPFCLHWLWSPDMETWYNYTIEDSHTLNWIEKMYYKGYVKEGDA